MKIDYIWADGFAEVSFAGPRAFERAQNLRHLKEQGKVWRREFADDGLLEGITDVTEDDNDSDVHRNS